MSVPLSTAGSAVPQRKANLINNMRVSLKLLLSFMILIILLLGLAGVSYWSMQRISIKETETLTKLSASTAVASMRLWAAKAYQAQSNLIINNDPSAEKDFQTALDQIATYRKTVAENVFGEDEKTWLANYDQAVANFADVFTQHVVPARAAGDTSLMSELNTQSAAQMAEMGTNGAKLVESFDAAASRSSGEGTDLKQQAILILIGVSLGAILISIVLAIAISRSITTPLKVVVMGITTIAKGNLLRDLDANVKDTVRLRGDEFGTLGMALDDLTLNYLWPLGEATTKVAAGDLTAQVRPRGADDELGNAFFQMVGNLRETVSSINESAREVKMASDQLADASEQAGQATTQVTTTIQQVALSTTQQAEMAGQATASVDVMSHQIEKIVQSIQKQAGSVQEASGSVTQLELSLAQATQATQVGADTAQQAAEAAKSGALTVDRTVQGMQAIQKSTSTVADRVREMGDRSEEIGKIVATIQDIASQTDLLALNAAIEAARAGEQGRGFAVVADEVRKLAERSATSSREIAELIRTVQRSTSEAVRATDEAAERVAIGMKDASEAGQALQQILSAAEQNAKATGNIETATKQIKSLTDQVAQVLKIVSQIGEQNVAATEEMVSHIGEVANAADSVAAAAQENSASVEEVSATAEELAAQVEEVSASASELAALADELQRAVSRFHLEQESQPARKTGAGLRAA